MTRGLLALMLAACGAPAPPEGPVNAEFGAVRMTQVGRYGVALAFHPDPPRLGELFQAEALVTLPDGTPLQTAKVRLDARMPQHEHGMETRPRLRPGTCDADGTCLHEGGRYLVDGFKFHMAGDWTVVVEIEGPKGPDSTTVTYRMQ